jgi:hypothetical protein
MFGLGLGGIFVQIFPQSFKEDKLSEQLFGLALILSLTTMITPLLLFKTKIPEDVLRIFSFKTTLFLSVAFLLSSLPFFLGGIITSLLFKNYSEHISKLYFTDLLGASMGCFLSIPLIELFGASTAVIINAAFVCVGAFCFLLVSSRKTIPRLLQIFYIIFIFLVGLAIFNIYTSVLDVKYAKGQSRSIDEFSRWNSISRISVTKTLDEPKIRWISENIWGVSKQFKGKYPKAKMINIDAEAGTILTNFDGNFNSVNYVQYDPSSTVHRLKSNSKTLVIGAGGGKDVLAALSFGASQVTAVELNPIIVNDVMLNKYREFSGNLYLNPKVNAIACEGRNFVANHKDNYDIIQLSFVDTYAATSGGAYALAENNLYTTEGFKEYLNHLKAEGIFSVCWVDVPGLAGATRLISLGIAALDDLGIGDAGKNIMVVSYTPRSSWTLRSILLKLSPFSQQEQSTVVDMCKELGFEPTYIPMNDIKKISPSDIKNNKDLLDAIINNKDNRDILYNNFPLNIKPTTDDSPFFFYQNKPRDFFKTIGIKEAASFIMYTAGTLVLSRVLLIGLVMVSLFYMIPLILSTWSQNVLPYRKQSVVPFLFYFSCIGIGFMLLEMVFLQKFLLFLGHPSYTLSTTLLSILFFSGLGSLYTQRVVPRQCYNYIKRVLLALLFLAVFYLIFLQPFLRFFMRYPKFIKILISVVCLMPISFLMGMPLPLAIKILHMRMNKIIPWMWGVNGACSVLASIIAIILAMNIGYNFTFVIGSLFYLAAFVIVKLFQINTD